MLNLCAKTYKKVKTHKKMNQNKEKVKHTHYKVNPPLSIST